MVSKNDIFEELRKLGELRAEGIISDVEFKELKSKLISQERQNPVNITEADRKNDLTSNDGIKEATNAPTQLSGEIELQKKRSSKKAFGTSENQSGEQLRGNGIHAVRIREPIDFAQVDTKTLIASGGTADIYLLRTERRQSCVKIYKDPDKVDAEKLEFLCFFYASSAEAYGITRRINESTSMPQRLVLKRGKVVGFTMQKFANDRYSTLDYWVEQPLRGKLHPETQTLIFKIQVLANLAELLSDLHEQCLCVIDLKPSNILVDKKTAEIRLLDCDSFCVLKETGDIWYPAKEVTVGYYDPKALIANTPITKLKQEQDYFAFSVIAFQILNNGIHPYQADYGDQNGDYNLEALSKKGIFPYSRNQRLTDSNKPLRSKVPLTSIYDTFPDILKLGFEKSFEITEKVVTVSQWAQLFRSVLDKKLIVPCAETSSFEYHEKFVDHSCGFCRFETIVADIDARVKKDGKEKGKRGKKTSVPFQSGQKLGGASGSTASPSSGTIDTLAIIEELTSRKSNAVLAALIVGGFVFFLLMFSGK